ncbi:MAG: hypothetical protein QOK36_3398 [Gaiellales bacterium]|nr:hypothetical protein [Gaiellales bacterium]
MATPSSGPGGSHSILYAFGWVTDRTDPYEIIGVRRDASLAEIRISYRRSTQILAPERFANANDTVRAEAARRLSALNGAMEAIEAQRAAESGSALGSLTFGGPAVSSAVEPTLRSVAIAEEPPALVEEDAEATQDGVVEAPPAVAEAPAVTQAPSEPHDAPIGLVEEFAGEEPDLPTGEQSWIADDTQDESSHVGAEDTGTGPMPDTDDTHDGLAVTPGEDTAEEPVAEQEADAEPAVSLLQTPNPPSLAAPAPAAPRFERERPVKGPSRTRSLLPRILGGCALIAALAAVGVYFLVGGGGSTPKIGQFQRVGAPVSFNYPHGLLLRKPPSGGLLKPTFSTAVGLDAANYVVVATYRISASVQADGSAVGASGSRLTADRFDQSVDRAAERIAAAQKLKAKGLAEPGKAGDMIARVYSYTRPGGSSARYAFAFRGHTEYSIACFWEPAHAKALSAACSQVMASLQRAA